MGTQDSHAPGISSIDLELINIFKSFGNLEVLHDLSLAVYKGELCCLLGPSGCGKTTALKIVNGLLEPESGKVYLAGQDITNMPPQQRNVGMVFQNYALFPHMSVYDNVAYGLRRRRLPEDIIGPKVSRTLNMVRLSGYEMRRIHELSGGQQQRIALARSLVIEPKLLLLDEPLSNLDARLRADMREEIRRIQRSLNITTVYVTHDQEEAISIADRIVVMNQGVIEQIGSPREIYQQPATRFVADFIGRVNFLRGKIEGGQLLLLGIHFKLPSGKFPEGSELTCAVRPESIQIKEASPSIPNAIIKDITYSGAVTRYYLDVPSDNGVVIELTVEIPSPQAAYERGNEVGISFCIEDLCFFPPED